MKLHSVDIAIVLIYFLAAISIGVWVSRRGARDLNSYFLGGKALPWYLLGISNASGMFDISGTMLLVSWLFVYGVKSIWLPWVWPTFNQIFLMVFISAWLRRSNVLTGAEWIQTRFGRDTGANLAHLSVVLFALISVVGMLAYCFKGIGKFAVVMLPWHFTGRTTGMFSDENIYAVIILLLTSFYVIKGGMITVVLTEVMQFTILTVTAFIIGIVAMCKVSPETIRAAIPAGWTSPFFGLHLGLDWKGILEQANNVIQQDNNDLFGIIFGLMFFKGVLASLAGPMPNYDMQRVLATRNTREASLMSWWVNVVLCFPRYFMVAGLTVLALGFYMPQLRGMARPDFEKLLPDIMSQYIPVGVVGLLLAGLIAAFMSNFAATINAAPAYLVNDIYKRFINPNSAPRTDVLLSRVASVAVLIVGILFGLLTNRIMDVMMWIVGALGGAWVMANVLKWIWWRFNGYGYFFGMMVGIISAMFVPATIDWIVGYKANALYSFPVIFVISVIGCLAGTLLSKPEDEAILKNFYKNVRPWGFWGPIRDKVMQEDPSFRPNKDFGRDCANVIVGIIWQLGLVTLPIYIVLRDWQWVAGIGVAILLTSIFLKFNWYDRLEQPRPETQPEPAPAASLAKAN